MTEHDSGAAPTDGTHGGTASDDFPTIPRLPVVPAVICLGDFLPDDPAAATRLDHVVDGTRPLVGTLLPVHRLDRLHRVAAVTLLAGTPLAAGAGPLVAAIAAPDRPRRTSTPATAAVAGRSGARARGRTLRRPPGSVAAGVVGLVGAAAVLTSLVWAGLAPSPASSDVVVDAAPTADRLPSVDGAVPSGATSTASSAADATATGATPPGASSPGATSSGATSPGATAGGLPGPATSSPVLTPSATRPDDGAPTTASEPQPGTPTATPETTTTTTTTTEVVEVVDPTEGASEGSTAGTTEGTTGTGETAAEPTPGSDVQEPPTSTTDEWLVLAGLGGVGLGLGSAGRHRAVAGRHRQRARHRAPHATPTTRSSIP